MRTGRNEGCEEFVVGASERGSLHKCTKENVRGKYRPLSGLTTRMSDVCHVPHMHVACRSSESVSGDIAECLWRACASASTKQFCREVIRLLD
jgi:hypothetical protein